MSGVRSTDLLILLVEALCFILGNENLRNFHKSKNGMNGSAPYGVELFVYLCSLGFSQDLHYHSMVLQFHASLF